MSFSTATSRLVFGREEPAGPHAIPWSSPVILGRVFLSAIFILSGTAKFADWTGYLSTMEAKGFVAAPLFLAVAGAIEVTGGLSILTGTFARLGALALFLYLIPTTLLFHDFWNLAGAERQLQMTMFLKNAAIMGGLLLTIGYGAGRASIDSRLNPHGSP